MTVRKLLAQRARGPMAVCHLDQSVAAVREMMINQGLQFVPVIEGDKFVGIVTHAEVNIYHEERQTTTIPPPAAILAATKSEFSNDLMGKTGK